jgi:hypothetical protein
MSDELGHPVKTRIEMSEKTAAALRKRGGILYVWIDGTGIAQARTAPPREAVSFVPISSDGWTVQIDSTIAPQNRVLIKWTRLPWPHFMPTFNPIERSGEGIDAGDVVGGVIGGVIEGLINAS